MVYLLIQAAWTEPFSSLMLGVKREVFPVMAFIGEAVVLWGIVVEMKNLHKLDEEEGEFGQ